MSVYFARNLVNGQFFIGYTEKKSFEAITELCDEMHRQSPDTIRAQWNLRGLGKEKFFGTRKYFEVLKKTFSEIHVRDEGEDGAWFEGSWDGVEKVIKWHIDYGEDPLPEWVEKSFLENGVPESAMALPWACRDEYVRRDYGRQPFSGEKEETVRQYREQNGKGKRGKAKDIDPNVLPSLMEAMSEKGASMKGCPSDFYEAFVAVVGGVTHIRKGVEYKLTEKAYCSGQGPKMTISKSSAKRRVRGKVENLITEGPTVDCEECFRAAGVVRS